MERNGYVSVLELQCKKYIIGNRIKLGPKALFIVV